MPPLISSRGVTATSDNNMMTPNYQDIQNDIILRESAYIADKLLKKLTPAQPVFHHTELVPIRQNRAEAPTAQIISPKTPPHTRIQKPAPPQMACVGSKLHFNNNLPIPQLKGAKYLGRRKKTMELEPKHDSSTAGSLRTVETNNQLTVSRRAQTFPLLARNDSPKDHNTNLYIINEETNTSTNQHDRPPGHLKRARDHRPTPGSFPLYPSQRLPPPIPSIPTETAAAVYSHIRRSQSQPSTRNQDTSSTEKSQQQRRKGHEYQRQGTGEPKENTKITGKRRPGQGVTIGMSKSITVPLIGPPPPERRWRNKGQGKGKGKMRRGLGLDEDGQSARHGWEEVEVRGGVS